MGCIRDHSVSGGFSVNNGVTRFIILSAGKVLFSIPEINSSAYRDVLEAEVPIHQSGTFP